MEKREYRIVMDEETASVVIEVLQEWVTEGEDLGGNWHGMESVAHVAEQLEKEAERHS